jgi:hypothetical protein
VADLKLGPLPNQKMTRVTVMLPEPLKEELDAYALEHSRLYEPVETAALIPHMLQAFLRTDRSSWSHRKRRGKHKPVEPAQLHRAGLYICMGGDRGWTPGGRGSGRLESAMRISSRTPRENEDSE